MCTEGTAKIMEEGDDDDGDFWAYLGEGEIAEDADDDKMVEEFAPLLFKIPADGEPEQIAKGQTVKIGFTSSSKLSRDLLDESDVFLVDAGWEVFLWMGKDADRSEKLGAFAKADLYMQDDIRTIDLPLSIVKSGYESSDFEALFV